MKISWQRTSQLNVRLSNMRYVTVTRETYEILRSVERTPFLQSIYCLIICALNECSRVNTKSWYTMRQLLFWRLLDKNRTKQIRTKCSVLCIFPFRYIIEKIKKRDWRIGKGMGAKPTSFWIKMKWGCIISKVQVIFHN